MTDPVADYVILMALAAASLALGSLIWFCLGPAGFAGTLLGYVTGLGLYCLPLPES